MSKHIVGNMEGNDIYYISEKIWSSVKTQLYLIH